MLTVREVCTLIQNPKRVDVGLNGYAYPIFNDGADNYDDVMVEAFGDYVVKNILACKEGCFEFEIKMKPVKKGEAS